MKAKKTVLVTPCGLPKGRLESFKLRGLHVSYTWKAHGLHPNEYLQAVAALLTQVEETA